MSIYTYNGAEFSEEDVIAKAKEKGMDLDSYINKFGIEKTDAEGPGKKKPVVAKGATVAGTKNTASKSAKPSSVSQDNPFGKVKIFDPLNITKNALDNAQIAKNPSKPVSVKKPSSTIKPYSEYKNEYEENKQKEEEGTFSNYLKESFDSAVSTAVKSIYKTPEYVYNAAASITNPIVEAIGDIVGEDVVPTSADKIMKEYGIRNIPADILAKRIKQSDKIIQEYSAKNGGDPLTAIENGNYLGAAKLIAGGTVQSFPMMAAAMLSGGSTTALAGIAASTAVSKADQLEQENPEMGLGERTINSATSGLLESYLGHLFTGASGAAVSKILEKQGTEIGSKLISNGLVNTLANAIEKNPLIGVLGEVVEEGAVELGNQLNDIKSGIRKELDYRAIANNGIIATGMAGTNTVPIYAAKGYMKSKEYNQLKNVNKEIHSLSSQLSNPYVNKDDKKIISSRIARLADENKAIAGKSLEKIKALPISVKTEINTINSDLDNIKNKYLNIIDNSEIPAEAQKGMIDELSLQAKELHNRKASIIEGNYIYDDFRKLPIAEQDKFKETANNILAKESGQEEGMFKPSKDEIDRKAVEIYNEDLRVKGLAKEVELVQKLIEPGNIGEIVNGIGKNKPVEIFETPEDLQKAYADYMLASGDTEEVRDVTNEIGFMLGNQVVINKKIAETFQEGSTVGRHELLHKILKSSFSDAVEGQKLKDKFLSVLSKKERDVIDKRLEDREYTKKYLDSSPDEYLTQFFEALEAKEIEYGDRSFLNMWKSFMQPIYQKLGFRKLDFKSGSDVYNFVKDYHKSVAKSGLSERAKSLLEKGKTIESDVKSSRAQSEILKQELIKLNENEFEYDPDDFEKQVENLEFKIKREIEKEKSNPKVETVKKEVLTEEDEVKEIIKENRASVASDKVQKIYELKGKEGAQDIINLFKPITKKIVDKRRDAPDFDRELLTDEIETGVGGILDLITKYNPESGIPLAAYINKYLPVRAIATSKRLLGKEFSKDVTEEKALMAEETVPEVKEKQKYANALESKVFSKEAIETINKKILSVVRTLKSKIDAPVSINRTITPLIAEIRDEIGKQVDIDVKTAMGGKKDNQLKNWLLKNKKYILENMTTTWLMGLDGKGGIPQAIQKQIDGKWVNYPEWVGKKIDRESVATDSAGRTSGAELVRRLPNVANNISNEDFLSNVLEPSGNPIRGRKESLAKAIAEETSFDIILNDFENDGPIFQAFETNQERQGVEVKEVIKTDFLRQVERGNIKFSLSPKAKEEFNDSVDEMFEAISLKGRITKAKLRRIVNNVFPDWTQDDKDEVTNKFGTYIRSAIQTIGRKYREKETIKAAKVKDAIRAFTDSVDDGVAIGVRLGVPSVTANLKNSEHIKELQDINIDFGQQLLKDVGQREGLELLASFWYPSVAGRTKDESKSIFKGKGSFRQFLQDIQDGFDNKIKFEDLNIDRKSNAVTKEMVDGNISAESKANDLRVSGNAWDFTNRSVEFFAKEVKDPNNGYSNKHLASLLTMLIYERNSALRSAAPATGVIVDPRIKNIKKYDYDHSVPARYVLSRLMDKYVDGKDVDLNKLKKDYIVTVIPLTMTESLKNAGLQSMMPYDYKDGDGADSRLQYGNKDISRMIKFSLSTKANLKWENNLGVTSADFKVGKYNYTIKTAPIKSYGIEGEPGMDKTFKKIANNLEIPLTQLTNNKNFNWVSFAEENGGNGILNTGNAFKVFGIVTNGLIDYIEKNNIEGIAFSADSTEPSRVRLYKTLASTIGAKLGWEYTAVDSETKENGIVFVVNSSNSDSFKNQSEIQQGKIKFSKAISPTFNKIIEENKGIEDYKNFSDIVARRRGAGKNKFDIYVPASAADFELLLYNFMGEGKKGEEQKKFFTETLLKPYANGNDLMDAARQSIKKEYKQLLNEFTDVAKMIEKRTPDGDFTYDQAIRVAMWNDEGADIPGLSQRDSNKLTTLVNSDPELKAFKDALIVTGRQGRGWIKPEEYWDANTIISDLHNLTEGEGRKKFLSEFIANAEDMFGKFENGKLVGPNINKVEAVYGTDVREALEDVLYRMITGKNKSFGKDKETSNWANWVSGSTGAIMFLNVRSAALQLIGAVNFLNLRDNNPYAAAKAFANQKQYWEDFATIWNSDKMKERRGGLKEDVAAAEIANAAAGSKNKVGAVLSYLLKIGYTPTQMADSFAIASGGAPFYRNRIKTYLKDGMTEQEAEEAAWDDFTKVSDETQQSGDPRDISKQQASPAGRLLLTFQNTAMQQSRIVKKAVLDLKNGRGDAKTNFAKIAYYVAIQNTMFAVLQQGLFAVAFGDDDEDEEKPEQEKKLNEKLFDVADGVIDTVLRGTGFAGGIVATVKNMAKKYLDERDKKFKADYAKVVLEGANLSPPIGSKLRKLYSGLQQTKFDKDLIEKRGWDVMQDGRVKLSPSYGVTGKVVEAFTNVPMDRLVTKVNNASEALNSQNTTMQRIMVGLGWSPYSAGIEDSAGDKKIREEAKAKRKIEGVEKAKETRERTKDSIRQLPVSEQLRLRKEMALDRREKRRRRKMG
jgi:hypothetical protein